MLLKLWMARNLWVKKSALNFMSNLKKVRKSGSRGILIEVIEIILRNHEMRLEIIHRLIMIEAVIHLNLETIS